MSSLDRVRKGAVIAGAVGQVVAPLAAPRGVAEVTEGLPRTPVRPVPATFAIWGPIFASAAAYAVHQARSVSAGPVHRRVGWLMAAAFAGDTLWEVVVPRRHSDAGHALVTATAVSATAAYVTVDRADRRGEVGRADAALVGVPVGALAGWTTLAMAISAADTLARHRITRSETARTIAGAGLAGAAIGAGAALCPPGRGLRRPHRAAYAAAMVWGAAGIAARGLGTLRR